MLRGEQNGAEPAALLLGKRLRAEQGGLIGRGRLPVGRNVRQRRGDTHTQLLATSSSRISKLTSIIFLIRWTCSTLRILGSKKSLRSGGRAALK